MADQTPPPPIEPDNSTRNLVVGVIVLLLLAVAVVLGIVFGTKKNNPTPSPTATPSATASPTATPVPSPTPAPTKAADVLSGPAIGLSTPINEITCDSSLLSIVPSGNTVDYADCNTYFVFVGSSTGPLSHLSGAPAGTALSWVDGAGNSFTRMLTGTSNTVDRGSDGSFPGHGVPPGKHAFFDVRSSTSQTEYDGVP